MVLMVVSGLAPCSTCPWRKTSTIGGADIPGFSIELMRGLSDTVGEGDAFRTIMACHGSACGEERACSGYVAQEGDANLNVRVLAALGEIDIVGIREACDGLDLWPSFHEMLDAYEEASQ